MSLSLSIVSPLRALAGAALLATTLLARAGSAPSDAPPPPPPPPPASAPDGHRPPPPEALAACKSLPSGASCSFTSPRGAETGECWAPQGRPLACRPKNPPPPEQR